MGNTKCHYKAWMRLGFAAVCITFGLAGISKVFASETLHGKVARIVDGDTIHLQSNSDDVSRALSIRMMTIDTPEVHFKNVDGDWVGQGKWGRAAAEYLAKLTPKGTSVTVKSDGFDKYHRVLGRVYFEDKDVNLQMVRSGWAVPYVICSGETCNKNFWEKYKIADFVRACELAVENGRGVFDEEEPLKELPYEFRMRQGGRKPERFAGDFKTGKYYPPSYYKRIPVCQRIFFDSEEDADNSGFKRGTLSKLAAF